MDARPVDPGLFDDPDVRRMLARRDIRGVYQHLVANGVSQARLAALTGQNSSCISEVLRGRRQVTGYELLVRIAAGLGIERGWMGLAYNREPVAGFRRKEADESGERERLLRLVSKAMFGAPLLGEADPLLDVETPHEPGRVGMGDVVRVSAVTARLSRLDNQYGGGVVHDMLSANAVSAERLLAARASDHVAQRLALAVAEAHRLAGHAAADAGLPDQCQYHLRSALDHAREHREAAVRMVCAAAQSMIHQDADDALKLFQLATAGLPAGRPHVGAAMLHAGTARAYAMLGYREHAQREIRHAWRAFDEARSLPASAAPECWAAIRRIDVLATVAQARSAAGEFAAAETDLVECLAQADPADSRASSLHHATLATVHIRAGNPSSGTVHAHKAIATAADLRSHRVTDRLAQLETALSARYDSTCQDLAEALRAACGVP